MRANRARIWMAGWIVALLAAAAVSLARPALAEPAGDDELLPGSSALDSTIAVMGFDALGMDAERVARLEAMFRNELARLARHPMPSRRTIETTLARSRELRRCSGDDACLAEIGRALDVDVVVTGNVAALGDSYILNIKVVDSRTGKRLGRIASPPLRGNPDELIDSVRLAAYKLLAPDQLLGAISVLSDIIGATVYLDGKEVGKTPLATPIQKLSLGEHVLEVKARDYVPFQEKVEVRFQKTTRVVVRLAPGSGLVLGPEIVRRRPTRPWYSSRWVYLGVGVAAALVGGYLGYRFAHTEEIDCQADRTACR